VSEFDGFVQQHGADVGCWSDTKARTCCLKMLLHMADISNVAKPFHLAKPWAVVVTQGKLLRTGNVV
jgi:hypothetical protein